MAVVFDQAAANDALHLLQVAHDRWTAGVQQLAGRKISEQNVRTMTLDAYGHAMEVLAWSRGLDDMYNQTQSAYQTARPPREPLLGAARYACNRAVHQLMTLARPVGGLRFPLTFPLVFDDFAHFIWAPESLLPNPATEQLGQQKFRSFYEQLFAGRNMSPALDELRTWFESQV